MQKKLLLFMILVTVSIFLSQYAQAGEFGILSETVLYPDGLRLDTDSKLQIWKDGGKLTVNLSADESDKREGRESLKGVVSRNKWFGFGIIWDPNNDNVKDPKDMTAYGNGSLKFWVKTETKLKIGIMKGNSNKWIKWDKLKNKYGLSDDNQWRFVSIPLSEFIGNPSKFNNITQLFMVARGNGPKDKTFHFDNVRWDTELVGELDRIAVSPSPWKIPTGLPKSFLAMGYDANNNVVDIYPAWSVSGINGIFINDEGPISIFEPASTTSSASITATQGGISGSASVEVEDTIFNALFNIFIDEGLYGGMGAYDSDDGNADNDGIENNSITLTTVDDTYPPGHKKSLKAAYSVTSIGWAGLFVQEGTVVPPDNTSKKDMSNFADGYIHFWVKTPVDFEIGLRSLNITAGQEKSKVMLSLYNVPRNNTWQEAYIALDDFKILDNRLDLSEMKVFFNAAVVGEEIGASSGTFYLSNIEYVRHKNTTPTLSVNVKRRSTDQTEPTGEISWSGIELGSGWAIADQYLEIVYDNSDPSWGAQIYTNNMGDTASPKYTGKPKKDLSQQPSGLIGEINTLITCPMAWMVLDDTDANVPIPVEQPNRFPRSDPRFGVFFKSDDNGKWGAKEALSEWSWLKDLESTKWKEDTDADGIADPDEIEADFSLTVDDYSTFLNSTGIATGWGDVNDGTRVYVLNPESPIVIYLAAKFKIARELQRYKTNTITVELYHY